MNAGSRMCQAITQAHCRRDKRTGSERQWGLRAVCVPMQAFCQGSKQSPFNRTLSVRNCICAGANQLCSF